MGPNEGMWEGKVGGGFGGAGAGKVKVEVGVGERCLVAGRKEVVWLKIGNWSSKKVSTALDLCQVEQSGRSDQDASKKERKPDRSDSFVFVSFLSFLRSPTQP